MVRIHLPPAVSPVRTHFWLGIPAGVVSEPATASLRAAVGGTSADPAAKLLMEPSQMASPAEMPRRYGREPPVPDWHKRLVFFPLREPGYGYGWRLSESRNVLLSVVSRQG
jgi:hypothetical protein